MIIRPASQADLPAIAALHGENWRRDYGPLLPPDAVAQNLDAFMGRLWAIDTPVLVRCVVAQCDAAVIGFALYDRDPQNGFHIASLHVDAACRGQGAGRALMAAMAAQAGAGPIWLEVLMGNHAARAVYAHWGGVESAPFADTMLGAPVESCKVTWTDPAALAQRLGRRG